LEERITRHQMFQQITETVAERSTCERAKVGAIAVKDNRVIAMGYGGAPAGVRHCTEVGCALDPEGGCVRTVHAEQNVIAFAAKQGISLEGADLYVTLAPCFSCAKLLINAGIKTIYYREPYRDGRGLELLEECGLYIKRW